MKKRNFFPFFFILLFIYAAAGAANADNILKNNFCH